VEAGFPLDTIHLGKNYTSDYESFTVDPVKFDGLNKYLI
jgi:hypothetical protein